MKLVDHTVSGFLEELASDSPAPGGGSAAALAGAMGAGLLAMVARLTLSKEKLREAWPAMESLLAEADRLARELRELVDRDTDAFAGVMAAMRLPKETDEEKTARRAAMQAATKVAAEVPLETLRASARVVELAEVALLKGNPACVTDAGSAALLAQAAAHGAAYNVLINLGSCGDPEFAREAEEEVSRLLAACDEAARARAEDVRKALES